MTDDRPTVPARVSAPAAEARERSVRRYVRELRDFYRLAALAVPVIALLTVVNAWTSPGRWWVGWVVFGFGAALAFKGLDLFVFRRAVGTEWEERKVQALLKRDHS